MLRGGLALHPAPMSASTTAITLQMGRVVLPSPAYSHHAAARAAERTRKEL